MNDKLSYFHSQGTRSMREGFTNSDRGGGGWGQFNTEESDRKDDRYILDSNNLVTIRTEESETNELNSLHQPTSTLKRFSKLIQKDFVVEEEENKSDDINDSQIIRINSEFTPNTVKWKESVKQSHDEDKQDQNRDEMDQQSFHDSDNYEFHSNLESLERIENEQKKEKMIQKNTKSTLKSDLDQPVDIEMIDIGSGKRSTNKVTGINFSLGQRGSLAQKGVNRSSTAIEAHPPNKFTKTDSLGSKKIRYIKTTVEDEKKNTSSALPHKMITSIMDSNHNELQSNLGGKEDNSKIDGRRGAINSEQNGNGLMTKAQKRKTFLNLRGASKIKNFFSKTFAEEEDNVFLGLVLNAWRFIQNLKKVSTVWRPNMVTGKQLDLIDDSSHFDLNNYSTSKRKKLFGTSFSLSREALAKSQNLNRKKQEDGQLMKWMLSTLQYVPIINPQSQFLQVWDIIHSCFIILNLLIQPIEFVTYTHMENEYGDYFWKLFPYLCFSIFVFNIILNFNIGFYQRGICNMERKYVMTHYFKNGFIWDLLALLPIIDSLAQFNSAWRIVNVFVACKYITFRSILEKYLELFQVQNQSFVPYVKLLQVCFLVLFQAHLFACLFLGLAQLEQSYNLTDVTWIQHYSNQQQSYKSENEQLTHATVFSKYIYSFYWSVTTMTTTGYGDIAASNNYEATYCAFTMIIAGGVFAYSFNQIGFIVADLNKRNTEFQRDINLISRYLTNINIKRSLQIEVTKYIEYKHRAESELSTKEEKEVLDKLGPNLRNKITMSANIQLIKSVPFLINNFSRKFLSRLALSLRKQTFLNNEIIFEENDNYTSYNSNAYPQMQFYNQQMPYYLQQQQQQQYMQQQQQNFMNNNQQQIMSNGSYYPAIQLNNIPNQLTAQNTYNHQASHQNQNIAASQSATLQPPQFGQQQYLNTGNQYGNQNNFNQNNNTSQSVNSFPTLQYNNLPQGNHTRKLSGSVMYPPLIANFMNQNNLNNVNSPANLNQGGALNTPNQHRNSQFISYPQNQQTYNQFTMSGEVQTNPNLIINNLSNAQSNSQQQNGVSQQNPIDDFFYMQTLQQTQSDTCFYIVERGSIQLYTKCYKYINDDITTKDIKDLKKGELFGELSFFTGKPRCSSAKSIGPSSVLSIKKRDFMKLLKEYPSDEEIYCQIHDEIVNNNNLDSLQIRCYSCDRLGHTTQQCNKIHFQPDKEKVILKSNYKETELQTERNKDVWRRVEKYKFLRHASEVTQAQERFKTTLQTQSQLAGMNQQKQGSNTNFTAYFKNQNSNKGIQSTNPFKNANNIGNTNNNSGSDNRGEKKKLTLRQLQTMQTQIVDQDIYIPPSPLRVPQQPNSNMAFTFQNINVNGVHQTLNNAGQSSGSQQNNNLTLNTQVNNQRSSFKNNDKSLEHAQEQIQGSPTQNFYSSFQSRIRNSQNKELIIFEEENETPHASAAQIENRKFISPTTVDTRANTGHPSSIHSIGVQSNPHHKKSLELALKTTPDHTRIDSILNNAQLNIQSDQRQQLPFRSSFGEKARQNNLSASFHQSQDNVMKARHLQTKSCERVPQKDRPLIKDIAAAVGDSFENTITSNEEEVDNFEDESEGSYKSFDQPEILNQRMYRQPNRLNKQKSFTTETTPQNQRLLKRLTHLYQTIGIPAKSSNFLQENLLFQHLQNQILQNLEEEDCLEQCNEEPQCEEENQLMKAKSKKQTLFNSYKMVPQAHGKKEMKFEFPSVNTDRMKEFKSYFVNFNFSAVLERLASYKPNAYHKRNRKYHIYYRDTVKKGFEHATSFHITTPANSRSSNQNQISKIANLIINSTIQSKKKGSLGKGKPAQPINKKLSIIESKMPYFKSQMMLSQNLKVRSNSLFAEESDDEF